MTTQPWWADKTTEAVALDSIGGMTRGAARLAEAVTDGWANLGTDDRLDVLTHLVLGATSALDAAARLTSGVTAAQYQGLGYAVGLAPCGPGTHAVPPEYDLVPEPMAEPEPEAPAEGVADD